MAASNSSVVQSFSIALIVFVMLTFVLGVTTYVYFKKWDEEQKKAQAKLEEANEANTKRLTAERDRLILVKEVLGFEDNATNTEILASKSEEIEKPYGGYLGDQKTYRSALDWLSQSYKEHYKKAEALQQDVSRAVAEKEQAATQHKGEKAAWENAMKDLAKRRDELMTAKSDYEKESTEAKEKLTRQLEDSSGESKKLRSLVDELDKMDRYLSEDRRKKWSGVQGEERMRLLGDELRKQGEELARLQQVVAQLRVADKLLQQTVLAATPVDDRVDSFDGRILSVNELDRTVLVSCGRTTGLRPGLQFSVFDPSDPQPPLGSAKGSVEVVAIESDSLVRCRVRKESVRNPIIPGDAVATSLWSPGVPLEVVIVGVVQLGGDPDADAARLRQLIERIGGTVVDDVSPSTTMLVDAGFPKLVGEDGDAGGRSKLKTKKKIRSDQLETAKHFGIKVMAIEPFLALMGLQLDSVRSTRLPVPVEDRAVPRRSAPIDF